MNWKEQLRTLEKNKNWDTAIDLLENVIEQEASNMNAYIAILYLTMNLITEEECPIDEWDHYAQIGLNYFNVSYKKFSEDPEYLY